MEYLENPIREEGCLFCSRLQMNDDEESLILHRGELAFVMLNRYPYTNGHLMVVPIAHRPSLEDLQAGELAELMALTQHSLAALRKAYGASSFNLGANIGEAAGAGVADHVHLHVVPRWAGDTNFMATLAQTRVVPETLEMTYRRLEEIWGPGRQVKGETSKEVDRETGRQGEGGTGEVMQRKERTPRTATGPL